MGEANVNNSDTRDKYMTEKVQRILDYEQSMGSKTLFIAGHNLKAVLTENNQYWNTIQLYEELGKENEALNKTL